MGLIDRQTDGQWVVIWWIVIVCNVLWWFRLVNQWGKQSCDSSANIVVDLELASLHRSGLRLPHYSPFEKGALIAGHFPPTEPFPAEKYPWAVQSWVDICGPPCVFELRKSDAHGHEDLSALQSATPLRPSRVSLETPAPGAIQVPTVAGEASWHCRCLHCSKGRDTIKEKNQH